MSNILPKIVEVGSRDISSFENTQRKEVTRVTITEAKGIMEDILTFVRSGDPPEEHQALRLGIEGLQRIEELRTPSSGNPHLELPSETKE